MADVDMDPAALRRFASAALTHADHLKQLSVQLHLDATTLGNFDEAQSLVGKLNDQSRAVHDRSNQAGEALKALARAAGLAAELASQSERQVAGTMHQIGSALDAADAHLKAPTHGVPAL